MVAAIPASAIVSVNPSVIVASGSALNLSGLILTNSTRVPIGTVLSFSRADDVIAFFGAATTEAYLAANYFNAFNGSTVKPAALLFAQYNTAAVNAYLRGGSTAGMTLAQLQAIAPATLTISIDGTPKTSGTITLSGATSFSNAASLIQTAIANFDAVVTGSITGTTMTVTAVTSGQLAVGQVISGSGVTAGTKITALGTGTGGTGTYTVDTSQTVSSGTISAGPTAVTYDSQSSAFVITGGTPGANHTIGFASGSIATALNLTQALGAITSQGAAIAAPLTFMAGIVAAAQNWASFMTSFEPSTADCVSFAQWTNGQNNRFAYVMWDTDVTVTQANPTTSAGYLIAQAAYSGTIPIYTVTGLNSTDGAPAAFIMGAIAAIDFSRLNGRTTLAFRAQSGLVPAVTSQSVGDQLIANGYNFYGSYATSSAGFQFCYPGSISGPFKWVDSYVNQIWLNANLQLSMLNLLLSVGSVPYNVDGYALIDAACLTPIQNAVNFGAIRTGVTLSESQAAQVNNGAGKIISDTLSTRGWYLQIVDPGPTVRASRGSPVCTLWYMDGGSVQKITLASIEVQ